MKICCLELSKIAQSGHTECFIHHWYISRDMSFGLPKQKARMQKFVGFRSKSNFAQKLKIRKKPIGRDRSASRNVITMFSGYHAQCDQKKVTKCL